MPELPEVETVARVLRPDLTGRVITAVECLWPGQIDRPDVAEFCARLAGRTIEEIGRRGKFLIFTLDNDEHLIIHLRMSGHLVLQPAGEPRTKHTHTIFRLNSPAGHDQELRFIDMRKFGRVYLVRDPQQILGRLGPEPLEPSFTAESLREILAGRKRLLKPLLLDQTMLAGVGNIYADEALFDARLHPLRRSDTLTPEEIRRLHRAIRKALRTGIAREGASIDLYIKPDGSKGDMQNAVMVYGRAGEPCYRCGTPIERIVVGGRGTHICPNCQRL